MPGPMLYCRDVLDPRAVDGHFADEAAAAEAAGATVALIDHDALLAGRAAEAVRRVPRDLGPTWYRGWMIPAERYRALDAALADRGAQLVVEPDAYRRAHELPGWYGTFADVTPGSVWLPLTAGAVPTRDELAALVSALPPGPAVVKDFVKSRKHEWADACWVPDLSDLDHLRRVVARFVELQGEFLTGGVVVRSFEDLGGGAGGGPATEARVWWLDAEPVEVGAHPDTPDDVPEPELAHVREAVRALGCRFVTTDLALRADGAWRVVEVGDGQVSDLPRTADPGRITGALVHA